MLETGAGMAAGHLAVEPGAPKPVGVTAERDTAERDMAERVLSTTHDQVRAYYAALSGSDALLTNATSCHAAPPPKYVRDVLPFIASEVVEHYYGCGCPIPPALEGTTVLDLGCGSGYDVYILSKLVGPQGHVIGIDMTPAQLEIAESYRDYHAQAFGYEASNVEFKLGYIEDLAACGIADSSIDLVVSNCVVNLSPFKELLLAEVYRVLKPGGELYFSDVYASRRLPDDIKNDPIVRGECLGGATYGQDFKAMMAAAGWPHFSVVVDDPLYVGDLGMQTRVGFTSFRSQTVRAIKCDGLEPTEEDYGQCAIYQGDMPETPRYFDFSVQQRFIKGRPVAISGNAARMLATSRYARYFEVSEPGLHRGAFDAVAAQEALDARQGRRKVDGAYLSRAYERLGYEPFEQRVGQPSLLQTHEHQSTMQVNITYACNLACEHCYLECGPRRHEQMSRQTMEACLVAFEAGGFRVMDITGGSPELHPDFERFVQAAAQAAGDARVGARAEEEAEGEPSAATAVQAAAQASGQVIVRTNLTLLTRPQYAHLPAFFARLGVKLVGSLPYYDAQGADTQRGKGVFGACIKAIKALNACGYGTDPDLTLDLVYNVAGPHLPLPQELIELQYKRALEQSEGVRFNHLYAFNNYALGRFAQDLLDHGMLDDYLALLADHFNAMSLTRLMCLDQVNVDVDGRLYDCEVNHVLGLPLTDDDGTALTISDIAAGQRPPRCIKTHPVCYSCTAGFGSSCGGALV